MATQSLCSLEFAEAMAAHLFFFFFFFNSVLHCVTRPVCSAFFHYFLLKKNKTNLRQKKEAFRALESKVAALLSAAKVTF